MTQEELTTTACQQASPRLLLENRQVSLMKKAREASSFNAFELTCLIHGGELNVQQRRSAFQRVETLLDTRDVSKLPRCYANGSREDAYEEGLNMGKVAFEDGDKHGHDFFLHITPRGILGNASPFGLVNILFEPAVELSGTKDQQAEWLPLSRTRRIIGTYCQTELGHGTFVRGIETTATFEPDTDEFVVHSPTITSTKFWPGGLGFSTTHAIVMARLLVQAKDYGPHLFIVQLRSLTDGKPLTGIRLGDVGLKMAYNGTDNGFASFHNVRIPRTNMLMGHAVVSRDGSYSADPDHVVLSYSAMVKGRTTVTRVAGLQLAQAVTIATRYSVVREQGLGPIGTGLSETSIMQYKSQHFRLLTSIAKSYAILFASRMSDGVYQQLRSEQENGKHSMLPYVHGLTAGMKAWATQEAADAAEDARKCCGGHGLLVIAGLPEIVASTTAAATFEGENYVLWQQVGRYLLKCVDTIQARKTLDPAMAYLEAPGANTAADSTPISCNATRAQFLSSELQLDIYRHRAQRLAFSVHKAVRSSDKSPADAWNEHMMSIISAARAHVELTVLEAFVSQCRSLTATASEPLRLVFDRLCSLFALSNIINPCTVDAIAFVEDGYFSLTQLGIIRSLVNQLLEQLLPDAIALTDAWDFTDATLCSALGMKDGNVHENIMRWVEQLPINQRAWTEHDGVYQPGWSKWVEPILKARL